MKSIKILMAMTVLLSSTACSTQIKNAQTANVKINGNCGMCKNTIEKAGNVKNTAEIVWNKETKMAKLTFDAKKTNQDEILKRIALAGYDSDQYLAPDDVYAKLPECCQYDREQKKPEKGKVEVKEDHANHQKKEVTDKPVDMKQDYRQLKAVFDNYFALKDDLIKSNGDEASERAKKLSTAISNIKMETLSHDEHTAWMKVMKDLAFDAKHIEETKDVSLQRGHFITLSDNMYKIMKVSQQDNPVYYQHCPMANDGKGANWLSKEKVIKNPYYGSAMLSCGKTVETIK